MAKNRSPVPNVDDFNKYATGTNVNNTAALAKLNTLSSPFGVDLYEMGKSPISPGERHRGSIPKISPDQYPGGLDTPPGGSSPTEATPKYVPAEGGVDVDLGMGTPTPKPTPTPVPEAKIDNTREGGVGGIGDKYFVQGGGEWPEAPEYGLSIDGAFPTDLQILLDVYVPNLGGKLSGFLKQQRTGYNKNLDVTFRRMLTSDPASRLNSSEKEFLSDWLNPELSYSDLIDKYNTKEARAFVTETGGDVSTLPVSPTQHQTEFLTWAIRTQGWTEIQQRELENYDLPQLVEEGYITAEMMYQFDREELDSRNTDWIEGMSRVFDELDGMEMDAPASGSPRLTQWYKGKQDERVEELASVASIEASDVGNTLKAITSTFFPESGQGHSTWTEGEFKPGMNWIGMPELGADGLPTMESTNQALQQIRKVRSLVTHLDKPLHQNVLEGSQEEKDNRLYLEHDIWIKEFNAYATEYENQLTAFIKARAGRAFAGSEANLSFLDTTALGFKEREELRVVAAETTRITERTEDKLTEKERHEDLKDYRTNTINLRIQELRQSKSEHEASLNLQKLGLLLNLMANPQTWGMMMSQPGLAQTITNMLGIPGFNLSGMMGSAERSGDVVTAAIKAFGSIGAMRQAATSDRGAFQAKAAPIAAQFGMSPEEFVQAVLGSRSAAIGSLQSYQTQQYGTIGGR